MNSPDLSEVDMTTLQDWMCRRICTSADLVDGYLARIAAYDRGGLDGRRGIHSVIEVNPEARAIALALDAERTKGLSRGPLHGIPVLIKDNIETGDGMITSVGSLALADNRPVRDAILVYRLRDAGAVILGKANLSEWANFVVPGVPADGVVAAD